MSSESAPENEFDRENETSENNAHEDERRRLGRENASCSCQSACDFIAAASCAIRAASPDRSRYASEFESLLRYVAEKELDFPAHKIPDPSPISGQEHCVWPSDDRRRVFKATKPNKFGFTVGGADTATPLEYFRRMSLTNRVFGDDIVFEGVANVKQTARVVIPQPLIVGTVTKPEEILQLMENMAFEPLEIGGQFAWYRREDNVLAFDAHTKNFLTTPQGPIPIDVNLYGPTAEEKFTLIEAVERYAQHPDDGEKRSIAIRA